MHFDVLFSKMSNASFSSSRYFPISSCIHFHCFNYCKKSVKKWCLERKCKKEEEKLKVEMGEEKEEFLTGTNIKMDKETMEKECQGRHELQRLRVSSEVLGAA